MSASASTSPHAAGSGRNCHGDFVKDVEMSMKTRVRPPTNAVNRQTRFTPSESNMLDLSGTYPDSLSVA
nr:hypothetical protein CFP56_26015 [Quercus suber]